MSEVIEESFEYRLESLGQIDRCDVACGSYGDKFHRWDDAGPYVEYEDHVKHVSFYAAELDAQRLRADTVEAELAKLRERHDTVKCQRNDATKGLAAAEQRIASHESILRRFANCADVRQVGTLAMDYVAALNQKSEGESQ